MSHRPSAALILDRTRERWVNVTWMPHTALSQTCHISLAIKSVHASLDPTTRILSHEDEWKVRVDVYGVGGISLVPLSARTRPASVRPRNSFKNDRPNGPTVSRATHDCVWDTVVHLPLRWRDLPRDSYLLFQIVKGSGDQEVVYQGTMPFFSRYGKLCTGLQKVLLKKGPLESRNHGLVEFIHGSDLIHQQQNDDDPGWKASVILDHLQKQEESRLPANGAFGQIPSVPWLDTLLKERAQEMLEEAIPKDQVPLVDEKETETASLIVELPFFDIPVLFEDSFYPIPQNGASGAVAPLDLAIYRKQAQKNKRTDSSEQEKTLDPLSLVPFLEYENENDNPVEEKYRTLAHDLIRGLVDPALKPNREQRNRLDAIIESPSHHPTREEKDLLWRFRFSLVDNRRALTKFLVAVDWTVESEVVQAAELLEQWRKRSPIEITDALKLLGKHVAFQTNLVREYAIDTLAGAPDSELRLYLLQLVQALKYENMETPEPTGLSSPPATAQPVAVSSLANFLIKRASQNLQLANYLYWYLKVEVEHPTHGSRYKDVLAAFQSKLAKTPFRADELGEWRVGDSSHSATPFKSIVDSVSKKIGSSIMGSEGGTGADKKRINRESLNMWDVLKEQDVFISGLLDVQHRCREFRGKKDAKESELKSVLAKEGFDKDPKRLPVPLPSAPALLVNGVHPETAGMFKSALYPALIEFHVDGTLPDKSVAAGTEQAQKALIHMGEDGKSRYKVIVKTGDDLRQDQLCMMMIQLMDRLLKRAALDLCLTPYSIIATSPSSGLVEFVEGSMPISQVLAKHNNSILQYFQAVAPLSGAKYDIRPEVMTTYIRSLAGYCVITYLLGIGDRHLDNILVRSTGHFFHIDFGFIFGRDPKPLPPAFRLTREMVEGMGGTDSSEYRQFCALACQAYNALRKSAGLVLNLVHLMSDAEIEDLSNNPAGDSEFVIESFEKRFRLDLSDEEAERHFSGLINDCLMAIAPRVMDVFHSFAVARR